MESGLLLDVVVRHSAAILQLLASKDKTLLVWGNAPNVPDAPTMPSITDTTDSVLRA